LKETERVWEKKKWTTRDMGFLVFEKPNAPLLKMENIPTGGRQKPLIGRRGRGRGADVLATERGRMKVGAPKLAIGGEVE